MSSTIIYTCPFVPAEWIAAHGLVAERVTPQASDARGAIGPVPGVCPYARAFANAAVTRRDAAGIVVTTVCDQMRRVAEVIAAHADRPVFVMNVPHTWQTQGPMGMYIGELRRLGRYLIGLGGSALDASRLAETILEHEARRNAAQVGASGKGLPLALVGGPLMADYTSLHQLVEQAGGYVALDATETGERTQPASFDRELVGTDPLSALAKAYFGHIPDPFRRPNSGFHEWLKNAITERRVRGIVLRRYTWCDTWNAEARRIEETTGLPLLHLDAGDSAADSARALTRLQAFVEMLR